MTTKDLWIPLLLALVTFLLTYSNSVRMETRKLRLQHLNDQLQILYGPLFSLSHASAQAWGELHNYLRPGSDTQLADPAHPLEAWEEAHWRLWMQTVFQPLNLQMEGIIIHNAHLIEGTDMPEPFQALLGHVEAYKAILKQWEANDFSIHRAALPYPKSLDNYVQRTFLTLSKRQSELLKL